MHIPETRYARSGDVSIAYQVVGDAPIDLVCVPGWVSHIEHAWEEPSYAPFLRRLAQFSRLIVLDRRGTGLSDRVDRLPTLEERMDDVRAVLDAAASTRAYLFGISEGGPMCALFGATHPTRTAGLVLLNTFASLRRTDDNPLAPANDEWDRTVDLFAREWGTGISATLFAPSRADDEAFRRAWGRFERHAVSPGGMRTLLAMARTTDVTAVLGSIRVPTLVLHRIGDRVIPVEHGRFLARHIPGARFVDVPGADHFPWVGDVEAVLAEIQHFVTGTRPGRGLDRVLTTVLFVDIVDSTRRLAELGDAAWRALLERFYVVLRDELARYQGREVDTAGDGVLATFDGPARAVRCAAALRAAVGALGFAVRSGVHTGECELLDGKVSGLAVHLGARIMAAAAPGEVLASSTVRDLVAGSGLRFTDRGEHALKGFAETYRLYATDA